MGTHRQRQSERLVIGITGRIGSGKTTVGKYLESNYGFRYLRYSVVLAEWKLADSQNKAELQKVGWDVMAGGMQMELNKLLIARVMPGKDTAVDGLRHIIDYESLGASGPQLPEGRIKMSLWVVVGGQYGSEGKGKVSAFITKQENVDICVRCGGPNSGHSFVDENGKTIVLRQLPTGFVNASTRLLIPAGALVDPVVLKNEIESLRISPDRIGVDRNAFIIEAQDRETERNLRLRERLSSTLCGVGAAQSRRVLRSEGARLAKDITGEHAWMREYLTHVSEELNIALDRGRKVLVEGTQGFGLSLYHSEHYPKTTSRDTTAAGFLSEVGVSPRLVTEIVVVFRTFPIRVAGEQAGPLKDEIRWEQLQKESGYPHPILERTSVTGNVRRVGRFDWLLADRAISVNRPTRLAINGLDYLNAANRTGRRWSDLTTEAKSFVSRLENENKVTCSFLGTGPSITNIISNSSAEPFAASLAVRA